MGMGISDAARQGRRLCVADMRLAHHEQMRLCVSLEQIADSLPGNVDRVECLAVANVLVPLLRRFHRYEEEIVFPAFEALGGRNGLAASRLRAEHVEDECFAAEVTEVLMALGHGGAVENAEAVGFMLRGLFETMRRHVAFEREHVLPALMPRSAPAPGAAAQSACTGADICK